MAAIAALLLAAGESRRMGTAKALLSWKGVSLLRYQIEQLMQAGVSEVIVVMGHEAERLLPLAEGAPGVTVVVNQDYRQGRTTSIKAGLQHVPSDCAGVMGLAGPASSSNASSSSALAKLEPDGPRLRVTASSNDNAW